jgi:hypothetical protein
VTLEVKSTAFQDLGEIEERAYSFRQGGSGEGYVEKWASRFEFAFLDTGITCQLTYRLHPL